MNAIRNVPPLELEEVLGKKIKVISFSCELYTDHGQDLFRLYDKERHITKELNQIDWINHGVDDIIFIRKLLKKDSLNPKEIEEDHVDILYTLDKLNNFSEDSNSIYIKLMQFLNPKYLKEDNVFSTSSNTFLDNNSQLNHYVYLEYSPKRGGLTYYLNHAYIVPAETLRHQIIGILNDILKNGNSDNTVELGRSDLNHSIMEAYSIIEHEQYRTIDEIELFKACDLGFNVEDIILRIPEMKLDSYIKSNNDGIIHHLYG